MNDPKRALLLKLRRGIKSMRRFTVEFQDGKERLTCTTCGHILIQEVGGGGVAPELAERLAKYRAHGGGVSGECPHCTKTMRDERYPL